MTEEFVDADLSGSSFSRTSLHVLLQEEWWHHGYAARDLAILARS